MARMLIVLTFFILAYHSHARAQVSGLGALIDGIEQKFSRMRDLSADFVQIYEDPLNRKQQESGHLYLRRVRMMRWEYKVPEEKLFVSDGKTLYLYLPEERQLHREGVRTAIDDRVPLMFLVGKSNLRREFRRIELLQQKPVVDGTRVLRLFPKRETASRRSFWRWNQRLSTCAGLSFPMPMAPARTLSSPISGPTRASNGPCSTSRFLPMSRFLREWSSRQQDRLRLPGRVGPVENYRSPAGPSVWIHGIRLQVRQANGRSRQVCSGGPEC